MTAILDRTLLTHTVIALGVSAGAWLFFVQPKSREVQTLQAAVTAAEQPTTAMDEALFNKTFQRMKDIRSRLTDVEVRNGLMRDTSRLYGQIMDLANAHAVNVQTLQPGAEKLSPDTNMSISRIDMTVDGSYENVAEFFQAIDGIQGFFRPTSFSLVPMRAAEGSGVLARFSCEAINFKISESLASVGATHDKP